ncbi:MAG: hypothetical protein NT069_24980, partial [Planctomycetota bacterium]|nr:hypothetical protein [Planctomycetota bacterium]
LVTAPVSGHQISLTRFLTGERPTTRAEIRPLRNFNLRDPVGNPGAIELFGRFARLDVGRQLIDEQVAIPATSTSNVDLLDAGAIWYLNQYTAAWFAWQHSWLGTPVETAPGRTTSGYELFTMRLQFFF